MSHGYMSHGYMSPNLEKVGALALMVDQALDFKAGLESKVPEKVKTGYSTALTKVNSNFLTFTELDP